MRANLSDKIIINNVLNILLILLEDKPNFRTTRLYVLL